MDLDISWIFLGLPAAFLLGWVASRFDLRQLRMENRSNPKAYFKGLNHLLNEQQDQAIDAFIEAVQRDPDTSELHFALGNLFRRRGEYERAVRVHQHLLSRGDISQSRSRASAVRLGHGLCQSRHFGPRRNRVARLARHPVGCAGFAGALEHLRKSSRLAPSRRGIAPTGPATGARSIRHPPCALPVRVGSTKQRQRTSACAVTRGRGLRPSACPTPCGFGAVDASAGPNWPRPATNFSNWPAIIPSSLPLFAAQLAQLAPQVQRESGGVATACKTVTNNCKAWMCLMPWWHLESHMGKADGRAHYAAHLQNHPSLIAANQWLAGAGLDPQQQPQVQRALGPCGQTPATLPLCGLWL